MEQQPGACWRWCPVVIFANQLRPLQLVFQRQNLRWHLAASVVYSLVHVLAMVALRKLVYWSQGGDYDFGDWWQEFPYEYIKDVRAYFSILLLVGFYQLLLRRWQGEATLLGEPDQGPAVEPVEPSPNASWCASWARIFCCRRRRSNGYRPGAIM